MCIIIKTETIIVIQVEHVCVVKKSAMQNSSCPYVFITTDQARIHRQDEYLSVSCDGWEKKRFGVGEAG